MFCELLENVTVTLQLEITEKFSVVARHHAFISLKEKLIFHVFWYPSLRAVEKSQKHKCKLS